MLVKCRYCNNKVDRKDAFKVVVDGKNIYYCNEAEYLTVLHDRKIRDDTYECINEIFGYKVINTALFKELSFILGSYSYDQILAYLKENKDYMASVIRQRDYSSEYAKIRYFSAMIKNGIADFKVKEKEAPKQVEVDIPDGYYKRRQKKRSLSDIEEQVGE